MKTRNLPRHSLLLLALVAAVTHGSSSSAAEPRDVLGATKTSAEDAAGSETANAVALATSNVTCQIAPAFGRGTPQVVIEGLVTANGHDSAAAGAQCASRQTDLPEYTAVVRITFQWFDVALEDWTNLAPIKECHASSQLGQLQMPPCSHQIDFPINDPSLGKLHRVRFDLGVTNGPTLTRYFSPWFM